MALLNSKKQLSAFAVYFGLCLYLGLLFYITFFAWNFGSSYGSGGPGGRNYNLEPFLSIYHITVYSGNLRDPFFILIGNILLFVPFGFLFPLAVEQMKKTKRATSFVLIVGMSMLLSIFIEINQFLFTYRVADIDDVILNTTGGLVGAICYRLAKIIKLNL